VGTRSRVHSFFCQRYLVWDVPCHTDKMLVGIKKRNESKMDKSPNALLIVKMRFGVGFRVKGTADPQNFIASHRDGNDFGGASVGERDGGKRRARIFAFPGCGQIAQG
jgi:hypothetical protein